jgi:hypothetical protein
MAYPINAPNSSTEASLTGQQDQSDPKTMGRELAQVWLRMLSSLGWEYSQLEFRN